MADQGSVSPEQGEEGTGEGSSRLQLRDLDEKSLALGSTRKTQENKSRNQDAAGERNPHGVLR